MLYLNGSSAVCSPVSNPNQTNRAKLLKYNNMIGSGSTQKQNQNLMMSAVISTISNSSLLFVDNPGALRYYG